jgi:hypothetical protein
VELGADGARGVDDLDRDGPGWLARLRGEAVLELVAVQLAGEDGAEAVLEAAPPLLVLEGQASHDLGAAG